MYVCICIYVHVSMSICQYHICIYTHIDTYIHICIVGRLALQFVSHFRGNQRFGMVTFFRTCGAQFEMQEVCGIAQKSFRV